MADWGVGIYAAYWAFAIRRRLVGRIYRNHALWLGVLCVLGLVSTISNSPLTPNVSPSSNLAIDVIVAFFYYAPWLEVVLFGFINSTIPVLRRSDPLLRNILHWAKLRIALWSVLAFTTAVAICMSIYVPSCAWAADPPACIRSVVSAWGELGNVLGFLSHWFYLPAIAVSLAAVALLIGARRSRDMVLRQSVKWLGVAVCLIPVFFLLLVLEVESLSLSSYELYYSYGAVPLNGGIVLIGYALYRSARSLAPLNRLPPIEPEITPSTTEAAS
jgi:hypothetical protein